ncbi:hypothetical protein NP493_237g00040 [Ridgeia piscesae]|uniref:Apple domain-containing protein n=1 Tax=Ridgeia piscesae TaxID=27915 RepID=A0AAD9NZK6_RIDPI|nr:hypothetical protein NP493_237g00040 [Ridgeia piscesae]
MRCGEEIVSGCKSFDFHSASRVCKLFSVNVDDTDVHLIDSDVTDHYETIYRNLFNRLPKHRLTTDEHRALPGVSVELCARKCVVEAAFKCNGFNYETAARKCFLLEQTPSDSNGVIRSPETDFYERGPDVHPPGKGWYQLQKTPTGT